MYGCEGLRKEGPGWGVTGGGAADGVRPVVVVTVGVRSVLGGNEGRCCQGGHPKGGAGGGGWLLHTPAVREGLATMKFQTHIILKCSKKSRFTIPAHITQCLKRLKKLKALAIRFVGARWK